MTSPPHRWSPPLEPENPILPYKRGFQFTARRAKPPPPFLGQYAKSPTASSKPLPCEPLEETAAFEVLQELSVGDGPGRRGSQILVCARQGHKELLVTKIYDPLYYPFADDDFPYIPNDVVAKAEHDFTLESASYAQLDERLGGSLIPKYHGSWLFEVTLKHQNRPVPFVLMEHLDGVPLNTLNPKLHTQEERLRVLALAMEAEVELHFAGVTHNDIAARNVICSGRDLLAKDLQVKIIDFDHVTILPLRGVDAPCTSEPLPESPMEWFWRGRPVDMREWVPDTWKMPEWKQWLKERWGGSSKFNPVLEDQLSKA